IQDAQRAHTNRYNALGVHLLRALTLGQRGAYAEALEELRRELVCEGARHVYARECASNCRYTEGGLLLQQGFPDAAAASFTKSIEIVPGHALATVGLSAVRGTAVDPQIYPTANIVDAAMVHAAALALRGNH